MFTNADKLTSVLVAWVKPMVDTVVAHQIGQSESVQNANEWVKKYFPVKKNYSIVNDLSFLAMPATEMVVGPMVRNGISRLKLNDEDIPGYASKLTDALIEEAGKKGKVTLFNTVELEQADFERLRYLLNKNLPADETEQYEVIL